MIGPAAASGDRKRLLEALRDRLAGDIDDCNSARDVAALSQRLMDVSLQLEVLDRAGASQRKDTGLDEFTKRLARKSGAAGRTGS